jgi:predicted KAP-like P-loop ATPase
LHIAALHYVYVGAQGRSDLRHRDLALPVVFHDGGRNVSILTDQPITNAAEDRFGRKEFATRIANILSLLEDKGSIVIGVNAPWGEGKTSVINMIEEELRKGDKTLVVRFNPWRFPDEERLLSTFLTTLADRIGTDPKTFPERIGKSIKEFAKALSVFQFAGINAEGAKELAESIFPKTDIEEIKERISRALADSPKRIVVFMDDIDRLDKKDIQAVFRLVKLTADFPNTAYVLAFDNEKVASALADQYGSHDAGRSFIEKIVQVPLPVPPANPQALRKMVFDGVRSALELAGVDLTKSQAECFVSAFDRAFLVRLSSPRAAKRYINALTFALPILKGEVDMLDLMLIEGIRAFYPKLYEVIRSEPEIFHRETLRMQLSRTRAKARFDDLMKSALAGLNKYESSGALFATQVLFPRVSEYGIKEAGLFGMNEQRGEDIHKRISSSEYTYRYFIYGIPPDDISDNEIDVLIEELSEIDVEQLMARLESLSGNSRGSVMVQKLRRYENSLSAESATKLALAIARRSDLIPESHPEDNFFMIGSLAQAASLLRFLIERVQSPEKRNALAIDVVKAIDTLPLAYEYLQKVKRIQKEHGSEDFIADTGRIFAAKLAKAAESTPIEDMHPEMKRSLYIEWASGDPVSLRDYIRRRLQERPEDVGKFLNAVLGLSNEEDYSRASIDNASAKYQFIADIIDPTEVIGAIERGFLHNLNSALPRAVTWFIRMHQQAAIATDSASE